MNPKEDGQDEGYFNVNKQNGSIFKEGICDIYGKEIIEPKYWAIYRYRTVVDGKYYYEVINENRKYGICNNEGKEIITPTYDGCCLLGGEDGKPIYFEIEKNGKKGACDASGKVVIEPIYEGVIYHKGEFVVEISRLNYKSTGITLNSEGIANGVYNISYASSSSSS